MFLRYFCQFKDNDKLEEVFISEISQKDINKINDWVEFDKKINVTFKYNSERTNFMCWDIAIRNSPQSISTYKVTSNVHDDKIEGLVSLELIDYKEVFIHSLEVAPWNREIYLGEKRYFRKLGLILLGFSIVFGHSNKFCGIIRLESLDSVYSYYKDGLEMNETNKNEFNYSKEHCEDFLNYLYEIGYLCKT